MSLRKPAKPRHKNNGRALEKTRAFYGRRAGPRLSKYQQSLMDELLPQLSIKPAPNGSVKVEKLFDKPVGKLHLEIGFGGGEHLTHLAQTYPNDGFIGCEPFRNGMAKMLVAISKLELKNVALYHEDALELMRFIAPDKFDRIYLLYPDPWPKVRHHKRRFVCDESVHEIVRLLKTGGEWRFACDVEDYVDWVFDHISKAPGLIQLTPKDALHTPWQGWVRTRYEEKAIRNGRKPHYVRLMKQ